MTDLDLPDRSARMEEPRWISRAMLDAIHGDQLRRHGGLPGVNADGLIGLALSRPRDRWASAEKEHVDLPELAAAYGYALAKNQGYRDANDRVAFLAMYVFLGMNGLRLCVPSENVTATMRRAPSRERSRLAAWIRDHVEPRDETAS